MRLRILLAAAGVAICLFLASGSQGGIGSCVFPDGNCGSSFGLGASSGGGGRTFQQTYSLKGGSTVGSDRCWAVNDSIDDVCTGVLTAAALNTAVDTTIHSIECWMTISANLNDVGDGIEIWASLDGVKTTASLATGTLGPVEVDTDFRADIAETIAAGPSQLRLVANVTDTGTTHGAVLEMVCTIIYTN